MAVKINDITLNKIIQKMNDLKNEGGWVDINDFRREISFLRFNKNDSNKIIRELKNLGLINLKNSKYGLRVMFNNKKRGLINIIPTIYFIMALSFVTLYFYMSLYYFIVVGG